jgi:hypothetical protein
VRCGTQGLLLKQLVESDPRRPNNHEYNYFMFKEFIECSNDGKVKWLSNLNDLKAFMSALFGDVGKWSSPGGGAKSH